MTFWWIFLQHRTISKSAAYSLEKEFIHCSINSYTKEKILYFYNCRRDKQNETKLNTNLQLRAFALKEGNFLFFPSMWNACGKLNRKYAVLIERAFVSGEQNINMVWTPVNSFIPKLQINFCSVNIGFSFFCDFSIFPISTEESLNH